MRLTINLDDDLYAMARSHAIATKTSISKAVGDLLRRRVAGVGSDSARDRTQMPSFQIDPITCLPVVKSDGKHRTNADIQQMIDDEDSRVMENAGWAKTMEQDK